MECSFSFSPRNSFVKYFLYFFFIFSQTSAQSQSVQRGTSRLVGQGGGKRFSLQALGGRRTFLCPIGMLAQSRVLSTANSAWVPWCSSHNRRSWSSELWREASELFAKCWCSVNTKLHLGNSLLLPVILHFYSWHRHLNQRTVTFQRLWKQFGYVPTL